MLKTINLCTVYLGRKMSTMHKYATNSTIYIYHDYGTSEFCHTQLKNCMKELKPEMIVESLTADEVIDGKWTENAGLICFGGGFDRGYVHSLAEKGLDRIKKYVESGGSYLGICAGAYFASKSVIFDEGGPDEVIEDRKLKFCPGNAVGPVYPGFKYDSEEGSCAVVLRASSNLIHPTFVTSYFNGGCSFDVEDSSNCQVIYRYEDSHKPAIVECHPGNGRAILSGVHFEYDPVLLGDYDKTSPTSRIVKRLNLAEGDRKDLLKLLLKFLLSRSRDHGEVRRTQY